MTPLRYILKRSKRKLINALRAWVRRRRYRATLRQGGKRPSSHEFLVRTALQQLGIKFEPHVRIGLRTPDMLLLDYKSVVQVDGEYWHKDRNRDDKTRDTQVHAFGFHTYIITDKEIEALGARNALQIAFKSGCSICKLPLRKRR